MDVWQRILVSIQTVESQYALSFSIFMLQLAILTVGVPWYLRRREDAKWSEMRKGFLSALYRFRASFEGVLRSAPKVSEGSEVGQIREFLLSNIYAVRHTLEVEITMYGPAMNAGISRHMIKILEILDMQFRDLSSEIDDISSGNYSRPTSTEQYMAMIFSEADQLAEVVGGFDNSYLALMYGDIVETDDRGRRPRRVSLERLNASRKRACDRIGGLLFETATPRPQVSVN